MGIWGRYERLHGAPGVDTLRALFQTYPSESIQYLNQLSPISIVGWTLVILLTYVVVPSQARRLAHGRTLAFSCSVSLLALALNAPLQARIRSTEASIESFQKELEAFRLYSNEHLKNSAPFQAKTSSFRGNMVFVIGESTTRRNFALYGYHRDTNPRLSLLKDRIYLQRLSVAPHSHTVESLSEMLTNANFGDPPPKTPYALIPVLNASGIKTHWLSNQNEYGLWENPISFMAKQSSWSKFFRPGYGFEYKDGFYDDAMIPVALDILKKDQESSKFIVLHLYAAHQDYCRVIPGSRHNLDPSKGLGKKFFGQAPDRSGALNCYDNAIRYIDDMLATLIESLEQSKEPSVLLYVSDHGEDPAGGTGHDSSAHSTYHSQVPHIWYFNAPAQKNHAAALAQLKQHLGVRFKTSLIYDTLLDLLGIEDKFFQTKNSLFSPNFRVHERKVVPRGGDMYVAFDDLSRDDSKDDLRRSQLNMHEVRSDKKAWPKVWAHRVNTLGKLLEAKRMFAGVELDLRFHPDNQRFFVHHDEALDTNLDLEEYLAATGDNPSLRFWFDWKNASPQNIQAAIDMLNKLNDKFHFKDRAVVETASDATFPELKLLSEQGFQHSYYVYVSPEGRKRCSAEPQLCRGWARDIVTNARAMKADRISYEYELHNFVETYIRPLDSKLGRMTWNLEADSSKRDFRSKLRHVDSFNAYLVHFPSRFSL